MFLTPICFFPLSDSQSIYIQENHFKLWTPLRWSVSIKCSTVCVLILGNCRCPVSLHNKRVEVLWFKNNLALLRWPHNLKGEYCYNILLAIQLYTQVPGISIGTAELLGTLNIGHQLTNYEEYIIVLVMHMTCWDKSTSKPERNLIQDEYKGRSGILWDKSPYD